MTRIMFLKSLSDSAAWEYFGTSNSGNYYYDKENITHMPNRVVRVWQKVIYSEYGKEEKIKDLGERFKEVNQTLVLYEIDCNKKTHSMMQVTAYDSKGSVIISQNVAEYKQREYIFPPDSLGELLYKIVCERTK